MPILGAEKLRELLFHTDDPKARLVVTPILDPAEQISESSAAIDLRLGQKFIFPKRADSAMLDPGGAEFMTDLRKSSETVYVPYGESLILHPRQFVLGHTLEYFRLPANLAAYVVSRSSWGRLGLVVATAIAVHPGFFGVLCLELSNLGEVPMALRPGLTIAQMFFHEVLIGPEDRRAPSAYLGATEVELPHLSLSKELERIRALSFL